MAFGMASEDRDWTYTLARVAGMVGFNEMRVRWKLIRFQRSITDRKQSAQNRAEWARYEHKTCPGCGALQDKDERDCTRCGAELPGRAGQVLERVGLFSQLGGLSPTWLGLLLMVGIYARMVVAAQGGGILAFDTGLLVSFGGSVPVLVTEGEWWRLSTAIFLHAGLWHLGFNLFALTIVGPPLEQIYGKGRAVLWFMLTGLVASAASVAFRLGDISVGIGASGAIMGLIGVAAGWGHKQKTAGGRELRNQMLKWCGYVVVFGFFIGADNTAHLGGFVAGGAIGLLPLDRRALKKGLRPVFRGLDGMAVLAALATIALCFFPLPSSGTGLGERSEDLLGDSLGAYYEEAIEACARHRGGQSDDARRLANGADPEAFCEGIEQVRRQCAAFAERGVEGLDDLPVLDPAQQARLAERWRRLCVAFD